MSPKKPFHMSREKLYERVWQTPMDRLASEFEMTGNGLAKKCKRHKIPYPTRGYWAKIAAGQKISRPQLPPLEDPWLLTVTFSPKPPKKDDLSPEILKCFERAQK